MSYYKQILFFLLISVFTVTVKAQLPEEQLSRWHEAAPIEKVYLHLDRQDYFAGQTCWFKAYFISDFLPSPHNSTLFAELVNRNRDVIIKKVLPVFNSITYGQIDLPDTLATGTYRIRAYTPLMLNQNKEYLYSTPIRVYGKSARSKGVTDSSVLSLTFFPEGGTLLAGVENNIAFKATDRFGLPVNIAATIKDGAGNEVTAIKSWHDGMGRFTLAAQPGKIYTAVCNGKAFPLPQPVTNGLAVTITQAQQNIQYNLHTSGSSFAPAYAIGQMQHKILFKTPVGNTLSGTIPTAGFPSGILQLTFFNADGMPLAERLVFIDNKEYLTDAVLKLQTVSTKARARNQYSIEFKGTVNGNFSVAVTDDNYNEPGYRKENIISSFLLTSDIPGYVHNPAFYFTDDPNAKAALDLVMLTNGWRRFTWKQIAQNKLPRPLYTDPGYISLSGKVNERGSKKSFADRDLLVWMATPDSGHTLQMVKTDAEGRFKMDSVVFFDKAKILFSDVMGKKSKFITVKLNTDSLYKTYDLPLLQMPAAVNTNTSLTANMQTVYSAYTRGSGVLLDNVAIEGRRLTLEELEKKYVSGLFAGNINSKTINLTGQFIPQLNIFEWLVGRVPSLTVQRSSRFFDDYRLYFRRQPVQLFLDEMPMQDASLISAIPSNQIALIKIYPQFVGARGNNAAIAIYTRRGEDLNEEMESFGDIVDYDGYSIIKEFYSPDYATPPDVDYRDNRLTLNWQPEVVVSPANPKIPVSFYNNDRTQRFKVVAEGVTKEGKLLMIEQTVTQ